MRLLTRLTARPTTRPATSLRPLALTSRNTFGTTSLRRATQDYGSGDGDPAAENPQAQGSSQSEHLEHPGPPAPDVGKGSGMFPPPSHGDVG